jgi:hypothetical protein
MNVVRYRIYCYMMLSDKCTSKPSRPSEAASTQIGWWFPFLMTGSCDRISAPLFPVADRSGHGSWVKHFEGALDGSVDSNNKVWEEE